MDAVVAVTAVLFLLFVVALAYGTVKAVGMTRRRVDRTISQARRTVEDTALKAKALAQPGSPLSEIAQLRLRLRTTMRATQNALHAAAAEDDSLKDSLALFNRLSVHGRELDDDLKRFESDPDRATLRRRVPEVRERTRRIVDSADALRWAVRDRAHHIAADDLDSLSDEISMETGALRHWTPADGPGTPAGGHAADTSGAWPEPAPADPTAEQTWSDGAPGAGATRPEITPPTARPTPPWQKKTRPESTT
ncbi:hypothetical protein [Streptomyces sp. NPDC050560]|uniref:hypothetical protein n=1 Tax=Streptomyces sp. NPDC050560 TaxID=3365630 RepID=UPI0037A34E18